MKSYFVDTWFWIALVNPKDEYHADAEGLSDELGDTATLVTSEMVFGELLAFFSREGEFLRKAAFELVSELKELPNVTVVPQTHEQFEIALARYGKFADKAWSLTDCASMVLMTEQKIFTAITRDNHFRQAGFTIRSA